MYPDRLPAVVANSHLLHDRGVGHGLDLHGLHLGHDWLVDNGLSNDRSHDLVAADCLNGIAAPRSWRDKKHHRNG